MIFLIIISIAIIVWIAIAQIKESDPDRTERKRIEAEAKKADEIVRLRESAQLSNPDRSQKTEPTKPPAPKKPARTDPVEKRYRLAGTSFRTDAIMQFAHENPDYSLTKSQIIKKKLKDTSIYKYTFDPVTVVLEPEPDNQYDPKAIKVLFNGVHIGYIKKGSCSHIHNLLKADRIVSISGRLYGGPGKMVSSYGDSTADTELEKWENEIGAEIRIMERPG